MAGLTVKPIFPRVLAFQRICGNVVGNAEKLLHDEIKPRKMKDICVVVMNPQKPYPVCQNPSDAIVFRGRYYWRDQKVIDETMRVACAKAFTSWRLGKSTHEVQQFYPHLFISGDCKYPGSVARDGYVVGCSGYSWQFDIMVCEMIISAMKAFSTEEMREVLAQEDIKFFSDGGR